MGGRGEGTIFIPFQNENVSRVITDSFNFLFRCSARRSFLIFRFDFAILFLSANIRNVNPSAFLPHAAGYFRLSSS